MLCVQIWSFVFLHDWLNIIAISRLYLPAMLHTISVPSLPHSLLPLPLSFFPLPLSFFCRLTRKISIASLGSDMRARKGTIVRSLPNAEMQVPERAGSCLEACHMKAVADGPLCYRLIGCTAMECV
jgi:hypothetical protein